MFTVCLLEWRKQKSSASKYRHTCSETARISAWTAGWEADSLMEAENADGFLGFLLLWAFATRASRTGHPLVPFWNLYPVQELCLEDLHCDSCSSALCFGCMRCISVVIKIHWLKKIAFPFSKCDYLLGIEGSVSFSWRSLKKNKLGGLVGLFVFEVFYPSKPLLFCLSYYKCNFWLLFQRYFETSNSSQPLWEEFINIL